MHQTYSSSKVGNILAIANIDKKLKSGEPHKHMYIADFVCLHFSWRQESGRSSCAGRTHGHTQQGHTRCS